MTAPLPQVRLLAPEDPAWAEVLARVRHDVYHTPAYVAAEARRLGGDAVAALAEADGRVLLVPLVVIDAPVPDVAGQRVRDAVSPYGYPGALLGGDGGDGFVGRALDAVAGALAASGTCTAFLRLHPLLDEVLAGSLGCDGLEERGATVSLDLRLDDEGLWAAIRKGHTNAIHQARRAGFETEVVPGPEGAHDLVTAYEDTMARLGDRADRSFGADDLAVLCALPDARVILARRAGGLGGAYLFFVRCGIAQMHLGGTVTACMRPSPAHLLIHGAARWAREHGAEVLHLGGGLGGSTDDSLFRFKSGFSPRRHPYRTLHLVLDGERYAAVVQARAEALGVAAAALGATGFFPLHRAPAPPATTG